MEIERRARVLVVSDDPVLGDLIALNLRQRGHAAARIDLAGALSDNGNLTSNPPDLVILDLEAAERVDPSDLRRLAARAWLRYAPVLLAADRPEEIGRRIGLKVGAVARPSDVGGIVAAARAVLDGAVPARLYLVDYKHQTKRCIESTRGLVDRQPFGCDDHGIVSD